MKWKVSESPKNGEIRTRRVFAWRKTKVKDYWVWLETYQITEKYFVSAGGVHAWWSETNRDVLDW